MLGIRRSTGIPESLSDFATSTAFPAPVVTPPTKPKIELVATEDTIESYFKKFDTSERKSLDNFYIFDADKKFENTQDTIRLTNIPRTSADLREIAIDNRLEKKLIQKLIELAEKFEAKESQKHQERLLAQFAFDEKINPIELMKAISLCAQDHVKMDVFMEVLTRANQKLLLKQSTFEDISVVTEQFNEALMIFTKHQVAMNNNLNALIATKADYDVLKKLIFILNGEKHSPEVRSLLTKYAIASFNAKAIKAIWSPENNWRNRKVLIENRRAIKWTNERGLRKELKARGLSKVRAKVLLIEDKKEENVNLNKLRVLLPRKKEEYKNLIRDKERVKKGEDLLQQMEEHLSTLQFDLNNALSPAETKLEVSDSTTRIGRSFLSSSTSDLRAHSLMASSERKTEPPTLPNRPDANLSVGSRIPLVSRRKKQTPPRTLVVDVEEDCLQFEVKYSL